MKMTVNPQELAKLVEQSDQFFTAAGGINIKTAKEVVKRALLEPPNLYTIGYEHGILFIYKLDYDGTGDQCKINRT